MQAPGGAGGAEGGAGAGTSDEGPQAGGAPQVEGVSPDGGQGEEASASTSAACGGASGNHLTVPFLCYVDAEVARQCLISDVEPFQGAVHTELTVIGNDLVIKLTAEDSALLQISTACLLNQLSLVVQTMQHFVPPFFPKPRPGKGG
uniref:L antigen family member 3 n=1 Tax=Canis lupus dingo TaxID=286419 RepID=A0A8C0K4Z1_CANLU